MVEMKWLRKKQYFGETQQAITLTYYFCQYQNTNKKHMAVKNKNNKKTNTFITSKYSLLSKNADEFRLVKKKKKKKPFRVNVI